MINISDNISDFYWTFDKQKRKKQSVCQSTMKESPQMSFSKKVALYRQKTGISIGTLSSWLGISKPTYIKYESAEMLKPTNTILDRLEKETGVSRIIWTDDATLLPTDLEPKKVKKGRPSKAINASVIDLQRQQASRISQFIKDYYAGNQRTFAQTIFVDEGRLSRLLANKNEISPKFLFKIASYTGAAVEWLQTGEGAIMEKDRPSDPISLKPYFEEDYDTIDIPRLPEYARAGLDTERYFEQPLETVRIRLDDLPINLRNRKWWSVNVYGDSMEPQLSFGDEVYAYWLTPDEWDKYHNKVVVVQYAMQIVIKRLKHNRLLAEKGLWLHSDNSKAESFFVPIEDIQHIWVAVKRTGNIF